MTNVTKTMEKLEVSLSEAEYFSVKCLMLHKATITVNDNPYTYGLVLGVNSRPAPRKRGYYIAVIYNQTATLSKDMFEFDEAQELLSGVVQARQTNAFGSVYPPIVEWDL